MQCHSCGADVRDGQKFCMECGASLRGVADATGEVPVIRPSGSLSDQARDEVTRAMGSAPTQRDGTPSTRSTPPAPPSTRSSTPSTQSTQSSPPAPEAPPAERSWQHDPHATVQLPVARPGQSNRGPDDGGPTAPLPRVTRAAAPAPSPADGEATTQLPVQGRTAAHYDLATEAERDAAHGDDRYDPGYVDDRAERPRRAFRLRTMLVLGVLAAAATVVGVLLTMIEIAPEAGGAPFEVGTWTVNDFGTNNAIAALITAGVIVGGALLWCYGFKWGAGLAGGAGAALAGWSALMIGLAEWPLANAAQLAEVAPAELTRDIGYWAVAAAGGLGVLVLLTSFLGGGRDRQGGLDPWIAALGAASFLVAAGGPLIPLGTAELSGNYNSETLGVDLPTAFFVGRLVQIGLLALCGVVGFLLVRRYGLGLAVGSAVAAGWMVATAATEQTTSPIGLAFANPGSTTDLRPHGVTIVGMALVGFFALVAIVMALLDSDH